MLWFNKKTIENKAGFTIIELLVTIAIIGIVTGLVMVRYSSFNSVVLLKNQAFKVALDIREAQVLATSVRGTGSNNDTFRKPYGVHFDTDGTIAGQYYYFFQDTVGSVNPPAYSSGEELGAPRYIDSRFIISEICVDTTTVPCPSSNIKDTLTISFVRPDFDAVMRTEDGLVRSARITISAVTDSIVTRSVLITTTGQITVE